DEALSSLYKRVKNSLFKNGIKVTHFKGVKPNPSIELIEDGILLAKENTVDFILAVGGGSSIDTAKSIAFKTNTDLTWVNIFENFDSHTGNYAPRSTSLPILAIPTTSGTGSQVTQAAVVSDGED